jgi:hypothetical protein
MKAITLRNIPPELAERLERVAAEERLSLNKTVIRLLEKGTGIGSGAGEVLHHDLDHLAGVWSGAEADDFDEALARQRSIDLEVWD